MLDDGGSYTESDFTWVKFLCLLCSGRPKSILNVMYSSKQMQF